MVWNNPSLEVPGAGYFYNQNEHAIQVLKSTIPEQTVGENGKGLLHKQLAKLPSQMYTWKMEGNGGY